MRWRAGAILLAIALLACGKKHAAAPAPATQQPRFMVEGSVLYRLDPGVRTPLLALDSAHALPGVAILPSTWSPAPGSTFGVAATSLRHIAPAPHGEWVAWETAGSVHDLLGLVPTGGGNLTILDFFFDSSAGALVWAPGGRYLAVLYTPPSGMTEARVYDARTAKRLGTPWGKDCTPKNNCQVVSASWTGATTLSVKTSAREYHTDVSKL